MMQNVYNGQDNYVTYQNGGTIAFLGVGDTMGISRCSNLWAFVDGTNQSLSVSETGSGDKIVDTGHGLNLATWGQFAELTVYDFQLDKSSRLTLMRFQHDVAGGDGHGGTLVSVFAGGAPAGVIDFVGDAHVKVVHT